MNGPEISSLKETASASPDEGVEKDRETHPLRSYLTRNPKRVSSVIITLLILSFVIATYLDSQRSQAPPLPEAPDFALSDIDGNPFNLSDYRGKVVLLDFMTTWCPACNQSVPHITALAEIYPDELVIVSISIDPLYDTDERLRGYKLYHNSPWIYARDISNVGELYGVESVPTFILINRDGRIFDRLEGVIPHEVLSREVDALL